MFLSKLSLRDFAFTQKDENFLGVWVGYASGSRVQRLRRRRTAVVMLVLWEGLNLVELARWK